MTALLDPGDEVIVPEPCFVAYTAEVVFAGGSPVTIATQFANDFQVTGAEIEAAITPASKALLIGYPNNPTGAVLSRSPAGGDRPGGRKARPGRPLRRDLRPAGLRRAPPRLLRQPARHEASAPSTWAASARTTP
jgi:hypothetical protein